MVTETMAAEADEEFDEELDPELDGEGGPPLDGADLPLGEELEPPPREVTVEERARAMGWHPLAEYRGDPRRWKPADEFVATAERETPVMRDQLRRATERLVKQEPLIAKIPKLESQLEEATSALREMREMARKAEERGYARAKTELEGRRRQAVADGDTEAFEVVDAELRELEADKTPPPPAAAPAPKPDAAPMPREIQAFADANPWWNTDQEMSSAMIAHHTLVMRRHPDKSLGEQLKLARAQVVQDFPDYFDEEVEPVSTPAPPQRQRSAAPSVARPSSPGARPLRQQSVWEQIPDGERAEAKAAFERQRRLMPDYTAEEYVALYIDPHADVLSVRKKKA